MINLPFELLNWPAIGVCFVAGQIYLTLWFTVIFGEPWAKAYDPAKTKAEHTKEVPGYTYGIGALCTLLLTLGIALLQAMVGVSGIASALGLAFTISVVFVLATMIPGYAFLRRWNALVLAAGSQVTLIFILSIILAVWTK